MLDWLTRIKGSITDALAYVLVVAKVETMQIAIESKNAQLDLLRERIEQLSAEKVELASQLNAERAASTAMEQQLTATKKELATLHEHERFDIFQGIAFKKMKDSSHDQNPCCPNCFRHLNWDKSKNLTTKNYVCTCGYHVGGLLDPASIIMGLEAPYKPHVQTNTFSQNFERYD